MRYVRSYRVIVALKEVAATKCNEAMSLPWTERQCRELTLLANDEDKYISWTASLAAREPTARRLREEGAVAKRCASRRGINNRVWASVYAADVPAPLVNRRRRRPAADAGNAGDAGEDESRGEEAHLERHLLCRKWDGEIQQKPLASSRAAPLRRESRIKHSAPPRRAAR